MIPYLGAVIDGVRCVQDFHRLPYRRSFRHEHRGKFPQPRKIPAELSERVFVRRATDAKEFRLSAACVSSLVTRNFANDYIQNNFKVARGL